MVLVREKSQCFRCNEASPGVEANQLWLTTLQNLTRASDHFIFDTAGAKGASKGAIVADQHSRPGPTIT